MQVYACLFSKAGKNFTNSQGRLEGQSNYQCKGREKIIIVRRGVCVLRRSGKQGNGPVSLRASPALYVLLL